ncbi:MAG: DUF4266 domain-containing protein [Flavobacteriales bacterium]|nr:DUF4266 domain-containing protein [Flavobacteriales bacterium]
MKKKLNKFLLMLVALLSLNSCVVLKGYEMVEINDPDMELSDMSIDRFNITFQGYREAASGGDGGKTGGGCGCN